MSDNNSKTNLKKHVLLTGLIAAGLVSGISLIVLFSVYGTSAKVPSPSISPRISGEVNSSEMPSDFSLIYAYGVGEKNILNTSNNTYTYDMICDPPIQMNLTPSDSELSRIWSSVQENDFFELKNLTDACPAGSPSFDSCQTIIPENAYTLTIGANGQNHTVKLRQNYELNQGQDTDLHKFKNITTTIQSILSQKEELKNLPSPRCGYL